MSYRETDVMAIEAAWRARDYATVVSAGRKVGVELDVQAINGLVKLGGAGVVRRDVIATLLDAATNEIGIAIYEWDRWVGLAIRLGDRVVVGIQRGTTISKAWPELKPWLGALGKNRGKCEAWAAVTKHDRITLELAKVSSTAPVSTAAEAELVRQIVERPDDASLRSVLADLLVDTPRGKLMRLEAESVVLPHGSPERRQREAVIRNVIKRHARELAGEIAEHAREYTFAGGFVDSVTMSAPAFRDHGPRLFALQPIRRLSVRPVRDSAIAALTTGSLHVLRALHLAAEDFRALSLAPLRGARFDRLEAFELQYVERVDDEELFATLAAPNLKMLVVDAPFAPRSLLGLSHNRVVCDRIEELHIRDTLQAGIAWREADVEEAFDRLALPQLRRLTLDIDYVRIEHIQRLVATANHPVARD